MANLMKHFTLALVLLALNTGFWNGVKAAECETRVNYASCEKDHPSSCVNICRSGLYFPPYLLIESVCEERFVNGQSGHVYYCKCVWDCTIGATATAARPPPSASQPPIAQ